MQTKKFSIHFECKPTSRSQKRKKICAYDLLLTFMISDLIILKICIQKCRAPC